MAKWKFYIHLKSKMNPSKPKKNILQGIINSYGTVNSKC